MRAGLGAFPLVLLVACLTPLAQAPLPELWTAPPKPDDAERLSLEPRTSVARIGEVVTLALHGRGGLSYPGTTAASCSGSGA